MEPERTRQKPTKMVSVGVQGDDDGGGGGDDADDDDDDDDDDDENTSCPTNIFDTNATVCSL